MKLQIINHHQQWDDNHQHQKQGILAINYIHKNVKREEKHVLLNPFHHKFFKCHHQEVLGTEQKGTINDDYTFVNSVPQKIETRILRELENVFFSNLKTTFNVKIKNM
jgi:hypothetical protein